MLKIIAEVCFAVYLLVYLLCFLPLSTFYFAEDLQEFFVPFLLSVLFCLAVTIYALLTKVDFTTDGNLIGFVVVLTVITGILGAVTSHHEIWVFCWSSSIGSLTMILANDVQLYMGNRHRTIRDDPFGDNPRLWFIIKIILPMTLIFLQIRDLYMRHLCISILLRI